MDKIINHNSIYNPEKSPSYDIETINRAISGDKDAFSVLFMNTYRQMYYAARKYLKNDEDIYDALQIGYTKAYKYISRLSPPETFVPWLQKIIENCCKDVYADICTHRTIAYTEREPEGGVPDATDEIERKADIQEILSSMKPELSEILILHFYDGMKLSEIAKLFDKPPSTVRSQFHAAKKQLLKSLKSKNIDSSLYSGGLSSMIAVSLRSIIGTDLLSAATAQKMLDEILNYKHEKLKGAAFKFFEKQRNRSVLKATSMLMALTVAVTCITSAVVFSLNRQSNEISAGTFSSGFSSTPHNASDIVKQNAVQNPASVNTSNINKSAAAAFNSSMLTQKARAVISKSKDSSSGQSGLVSSNIIKRTPEFIPDYRPEKANKYTQLFNNSSGQALIDQQDEWIYYILHHRLIKIKKNGAGRTVLFEASTNILSLNVIGDWIYFVMPHDGLYRIRTDGKKREMLAAGNCGLSTYVLNNSIYYSAEVNAAKSNIYRYDIDAKKSELILSNVNIYCSFYMTDKYILYYQNGYLHAYSLSSKSSHTVAQSNDMWAKRVLIEGDYVYWASEAGVMRAKYTIQSPKTECIYNLAEPRSQFLNTFDHTLGFTDKAGSLYLLNTNTLKCSQSAVSLGSIITTDGRIENGYYIFEAGYVWGLTPNQPGIARVNYSNASYTEYF